MAYKSLRDFIAVLEADGELVRVAEPVSTHLEMTEIQTRLLRNGGLLIVNECNGGRLGEVLAEQSRRPKPSAGLHRRMA